MREIKIFSIVAAALLAGAFLASPELRAFAANTVGSIDIIDGSIQSVDIGNGQVKAADIATDAVGASEIKGVAKLIFAECSHSSSSSRAPGESESALCSVPGVDLNDDVIATKNGGSYCFEIRNVLQLQANQVVVLMANDCTVADSLGNGKFSIIVFDK
jgi:hypothetical protein